MSNEITVRLKCTIEQIKEILENKEFKVTRKFNLDDTYFIPKWLEIKNMNVREILSQAVLLRDIMEFMPEEKITKLTFKSKKINDNGEIISQNKVDCEIIDAKQGREFIEAIGYEALMNIKEEDITYTNRDLDITIKDIENGEKLIEVENIPNNPELDTIEKIKQKINELNIPIDTNDYFVKKAEIELLKVL